MKEHVEYKLSYEAFDGKMFDNYEEGLDHELNELYKNSGIRFIDRLGNVIEHVEICRDETYNEADIITIDRSKKEENEKFVNTAIEELGWCLLEDLLYEKGNRFRMVIDDLIPID